MQASDQHTTAVNMSEHQGGQAAKNESLKEQTDDFNQALADWIASKYPQQLQALGKWMQQAAERFAPMLLRLQAIDWQALNERLNKLPKASREAMEVASRQGWFFNWQVSLDEVIALTNKIRSATDAEEIDQILASHYNESWDSYLQLLATAYPARRAAIEVAVKAHREFGEGAYTLSIPVFLAQADGIFSEITGTGTESAMGKERGKKLTRGSERVKAEIGDDTDANQLLFPILQLHELDILKNQKGRDAKCTTSGKTFNALNRHQVMHGVLSDYGTELNSLKAFSLLVFVALHVPDIIKSAKERAAAQKGSSEL